MLICFYSHDYFVLFEANYIFDKVSHDNWVIFVIFLAALKQYLPNYYVNSVLVTALHSCVRKGIFHSTISKQDIYKIYLKNRLFFSKN